VKAVAETLGVSRSNLVERLGSAKPRRRYQKARSTRRSCRGSRRLVDARPTYGYRRITALLKRDLAAEGLAPANHKRVYRLMKLHGLLLEKHSGQRPGRSHDGKVVVMRSDLRWCSDGFEFTCWNGAVVRFGQSFGPMAFLPSPFVLDAHDREVQSSGKRSPGSFSDPPHTWRATANAGISGSDIRDMMLEAVEARFGGLRTPHPVEWLSDNGSIYTAHDTRMFATQLNLVPCFTPVKSPESNGMSEAFVKTLKRDYLRVSPVPDATTALDQIAGGFDDLYVSLSVKELCSSLTSYEKGGFCAEVGRWADMRMSAHRLVSG
jgi:putative transposase